MPSDYDNLLDEYSSKGYRVLACGFKKLGNDASTNAARVYYETRLTFLGFIVFENKLKPATLDVLNELNAADIKVAMVTGDNLLTAVSVGRACRIVGKEEPVFFPISYGTNYMLLSAQDTRSRERIDIQLEHLMKLRITIACSGDMFDSIIGSLNPELLSSFLKNCSIFGRMSPSQKKRLVECYQSLKECICFCGDGANDCAALMAADVGISLSQAEASVAAPFTSNQCDISSVLVLLKTGRSSIVTAFVSFKFMSLYSIIQFTTLSLLYTFGSTLSDWQFTYMDLFLIIPLGVLINQYEPAKTLSLSRPSVKLISAPVLVSIFAQMIWQAIFQGALFFQTRLIAPPTTFADGPNVENIEATSLAMFSVFAYLTQAIVFSEGRPHRQKLSLPLAIYFVAAFLVNLFLLFSESSWLMELMEFVPVPHQHRLFILALSLVYMVSSYLINKIFRKVYKK